MKHKGTDYKISAVRHYLNNKSLSKTRKIFGCSKGSLHRWVQRYKNDDKNITRKNKKSISYKIRDEQVKTALDKIDKNEQLTMTELLVDLKNQYKDLDITHEHFPKLRYKKPIYKQSELDNFYNEIRKYPLDKIISLDETSIGSHLKPTYSRCYLGKRCVIKTDNNFVFRSFTLLVAINNKKCVGKELYEKGGTTKERMVEFLEKHIFPNYKDHLIILDNAKSHHNDMVKETILKSGNKYLFSVPYTPKTNAIEMYFNQLKTYMKKARNIKSIQELEMSVENSIKQIKQSNYKNYFDFAYGDKTQFSYTNKSSTRKRKLKLYKL
jgi:transposase-like protein/transposase